MTTVQVQTGPVEALYRTDRAVLIGHTNPAIAGALAHAIHQLGLTSIPAFDADQTRAHLNGGIGIQLTVVLLDTRLAPDTLDDLILTARRHTRAAIMTLWPRPGHSEQGLAIDAQLGLDTPVESIAALTYTLAHRWHHAERHTLSWGPLRLDPATHEAHAGTRRLELTSAQFRILATLITAAGAIVSATDIANSLYGTNHPSDSHRIRAHIVRLRRQLRDTNPATAALLVTVRSEGYRLTYPTSGRDHV